MKPKKAISLVIMVVFLVVALFAMSGLKRQISASKKPTQKPEFLLVIHGGAGNITPETIPDSLAKKYHEELQSALIVGYKILSSGGTSVDAVEKVVMYLENCPLFNAGKGAVYTAEGMTELDASIMYGKTEMAGAVAGVTTVKNPISAARAVMENTPHVLLVSKGAEAFASQVGLEIVDPVYFQTPEQYKEWKMANDKQNKKGTVGAVALDKRGDLAAATSTGGMIMKQWGRVGDSPIIGAGTYASNRSCAVSCTGHGEYFIRNSVAYDLSAQMIYKNATLKEAANNILHQKLKEQGGTGGIIAIDKDGNYVMDFNTAGMFRGCLFPNGETKIMMFDDSSQ